VWRAERLDESTTARTLREALGREDKHRRTELLALQLPTATGLVAGPTIVLFAQVEFYRSLDVSDPEPPYVKTPKTAEHCQMSGATIRN